LRRSHDRPKGLGALHLVRVWASEYGLSLGQMACDEQSNEITAIPELRKLVDIKGAILTIDAMGTQKAIAEPIVEGKADYHYSVRFFWTFCMQGCQPFRKALVFQGFPETSWLQSGAFGALVDTISHEMATC
jgi:hypothetical protein